jgi:hypothetical protein
MGSQYFISDKCDSLWHICELNYNFTVKDNFMEEQTRGDIILLIAIAYICIMSTLSHCFVKLDEKTIPDSEFKGYYFFGFISSIYIAIVLLIKYITGDQLEVCSYPRFCNEGFNDEIVETNYYYLKDKCPRENAWIVDEYNHKNGQDLSTRDDTEYGFCSISTEEISCSERSHVTYFDVNSYSEYLEYITDYNGAWPVRLSKVDEEGTNCPSIEEVIYDYSAKEEDNYSLSLLGVSFVYNFIVMILIILCRFCRKKEYVKTRSFEPTDVENKRSEILPMKNSV